MKHEVKNKVNLGKGNYRVAVELVPENELERKAISNAVEAEATPSERQLLDNYLLFSIFKQEYAVVAFVEQKGSVFIIDISMN